MDTDDYDLKHLQSVAKSLSRARRGQATAVADILDTIRLAAATSVSLLKDHRILHEIVRVVDHQKRKGSADCKEFASAIHLNLQKMVDREDDSIIKLESVIAKLLGLSEFIRESAEKGETEITYSLF